MIERQQHFKDERKTLGVVEGWGGVGEWGVIGEWRCWAKAALVKGGVDQAIWGLDPLSFNLKSKICDRL